MEHRGMEERDMMRKCRNILALICASVAFGATLTLAGGVMMKGRVTAIDDKSMATVLAEDGKEYKVKGEGWKVGTLVECDMQEGMTVCKAASTAPKM